MSAERRHRYPVLARIFGTVPGVRWLVGGIAATAIACALVARTIAGDDFPSYAEAFWWAIQTVTTVGYGDVTPETNEGRAVASVLMVAAVAFISLLTAAISAGFVQRISQRRMDQHQDRLLVALERIEERLERLEQLEQQHDR